MRGVVTDDGGAVVPGTVVTLTNIDTSAARTTLADAAGVYQFLQTAPGNYQLKAEKPGFKVAVQNALKLVVSTPATLDIKLEVGAVAEAIFVTAEVSGVNTVDATIGNPFNESQVRQLPLQTRNVVELLSIQPGVTPSGEVLGARRDQNNVTLDGVDANDNQNSGIANGGPGNGSNAGNPGDNGFNAALPVPLDSVQEFRVTVGGQGADMGRSSGGQVTLITKGGSNQWHGSLYEFNRNTATTANNWFSNRAGVKREALVRNQFGGSVGGKIIRDRAFFFLNYEKRIDASGRAVTRNVPTQSLKQGIVTVRLNNGTTQTLSPAEVAAIDPLRRGFTPAMRDFLAFYPTANDNSLGADRGLNFAGHRFNSPFRQDDQAYVAKFDFNIDRAGKHTASWRGTLADNSQDVNVAYFPGQAPASRLLNNSKGFASRYTAVITPTIVNVLSVGLTRLGLEQSGTQGASLSFDSIDAQQNFGARGFARRSPAWNISDTINWNRGSHNVSGGINFRFIKFDRSAQTNSFPSYSFSRNTLLGLGSDINNATIAYLRERNGNSALALADGASNSRAMGAVLGILNQYGVTYNFQKDGSAQALGSPVARTFATNEYEFFLQDSWRTTSELTLTYGVRYSNSAPPWETNGVQVGTTVGIDQFFADRVGAMLSGTPNSQTPSSLLTYALNGPANGTGSWYRRDNNNWAPRFGFAFSPNKDNWVRKIMGKSSVFRGGAGVTYDRYGSDMIVEFDRSGSPGLATSLSQPFNTDFTTSARYATGLPTLPTTTSGAFPFTPPAIVGGFGSYLGIDPGLKAPYSMLLNASYARELKGKVTLEVGYAGRLSRASLLQVDTFQPLTRFKDARSGQDWAQASGVLRDAFERGLTPAQLRANPALLPAQPWFENLAPGLRDSAYPGSATANYFDLVYNTYDGSDLDALNDIDRLRSTRFPNCIIATGCNSVFALQNAGNRTWRNIGFANYHGMTMSLRRPLSNGISFDFNYTLSHSIDNSSAAESGAGTSGAVVQDAFDYGAFRGSSDFDIRHNITGASLIELPFGRGKAMFSDLPGWANQFVGGWGVNAIMRYRSGLPTTISNGGIYPTNYLNSAIAVVKPGANASTGGQTYNQNGNPSAFANTNETSNYIGQYPGRTGARAILRLDDMINFDLAATKTFMLPFESHRIVFRAEAFNAFNNVNFQNPSLSLSTPATFGEYRTAMAPRVMQFALRYEF
ncbi:MAG: carboxypeptidase regulatory-like domain-containing protein [Bryobacteraceae bacterium]|nr:carboxypeptidase regulatory-like domain-containing protein [Bryobacteraceae bacterium]